jgi:hypothetical protein
VAVVIEERIAATIPAAAGAMIVALAAALRAEDRKATAVLIKLAETATALTAGIGNVRSLMDRPALASATMPGIETRIRTRIVTQTGVESDTRTKIKTKIVIGGETGIRTKIKTKTRIAIATGLGTANMTGIASLMKLTGTMPETMTTTRIARALTKTVIEMGCPPARTMPAGG